MSEMRETTSLQAGSPRDSICGFHGGHSVVTDSGVTPKPPPNDPAVSTLCPSSDVGARHLLHAERLPNCRSRHLKPRLVSPVGPPPRRPWYASRSCLARPSAPRPFITCLSCCVAVSGWSPLLPWGRLPLLVRASSGPPEAVSALPGLPYVGKSIGHFQRF